MLWLTSSYTITCLPQGIFFDPSEMIIRIVLGYIVKWDNSSHFFKVRCIDITGFSKRWKRGSLSLDLRYGIQILYKTCQIKRIIAEIISEFLSYHFFFLQNYRLSKINVQELSQLLLQNKNKKRFYLQKFNLKIKPKKKRERL